MCGLASVPLIHFFKQRDFEQVGNAPIVKIRGSSMSVDGVWELRQTTRRFGV